MDIIKIKDVIMDNGSQEFATLFNTNFKNKYCYVINWNYIVPMDNLTNDDVISISQSDNISEVLESKHVPYIIISTYRDYIDWDVTKKINDVQFYRNLNSYTIDANITLEEIKKFRTWLAKTLFDVNGSAYSEDIKTMLKYYSLEMFDSTVNTLDIMSAYGNEEIINLSNIKSSCTCSETYNKELRLSTNICNPLSLYKEQVYNLMVKTFSEVDFWIENSFILIDFKKYIDNIISYNLPLETDYIHTTFCGCDCLNQSAQTENIQLLKNLSDSLEYIINGEQSSHKQFIYTSLNNWAQRLYEKMRW